jgi:hypothetical protein
MIVPSHQRCCYPNCGQYADHQHHVTYTPEVTKALCRAHHEDITIINGQQARKYRRGLSNRHRWWIWFQWQEGKLKPRRTRKALDYIAVWDDPSSRAPQMLMGHEPPAQSASMPESTDAPTEATKKRRPKKKKKAAAKGKAAARKKRRSKPRKSGKKA